MKLPNYLLLGTLCLATLPAFAQESPPPCQELKCEVSVQYSPNADAEITLKTQESIRPTVYLLSRKSRQIAQKSSSLIVKHVPPGKYLLLINDEDGKYCPGTLELTVESKTE